MIVVSILLAFAVDAWWDRYQDREKEEVVIRSLLAEIQDATQELDLALFVHSETMCFASRWGATTPDTPTDSLAHIASNLRWHRTPSLSLSTASAILSSGQLDLIEDERLREWISSWPGVRDDLEEELGGIIQFVRFVMPAYFVSAGIPNASLGSKPHPLYPQESVRRLVGDPGFQRLTEQAYELNEVLVREGLAVRQVLQNGAELSKLASGISASPPNPELGMLSGTFRPAPENRDVWPPDWSIDIRSAGEHLVLELPGDGLPIMLLPSPDPRDEEGSVFYLVREFQRFEFTLEGGQAVGLSYYDSCGPGRAGEETLVRVP